MKTRLSLRYLAPLCLYLGGTLAAFSTETVTAAGVAPVRFVNVADFGAIADDGKDDREAIQRAIDYAIAHRIAQVVFEAGTYDIASLSPRAITTENHPTYADVILRIFGEGDFDLNDRNMTNPSATHVNIVGATGLSLQGATDAEGKPATKILRLNKMENDKYMPAIFMFAGCDDITMRNLVFDNNPNHSTSGKVVEVGADYVIAEIFEGLPRIDGMASYCANAWDLQTGKLKKVPSLTFGTSPANWRTIEGGNGRLMRIDGVDFGKYLEAGDGISWWIGHHGRQIRFWLCRDIVVENVLVLNAAGFGIEAFNSVNLYADQVDFRPQAPQLPLSPRDAWKLAFMDGNVMIKNMHVEGVRWDGQNVHGSWGYVHEQTSPRSVTLKKRGGVPVSLLKVGTEIGFWDGNENTKRTIASWAYRGSRNTLPEGGDWRTEEKFLEVVFDEDLPDFITTDTLCTVYAWDINRYTLRDGTFEKIAGAMSVIKNENVLIENCTFDNIQQPPIVIATERTTHMDEGTFPRNVTVQYCTFSDSGWIQRLGFKGLIAIGDGWGEYSRTRDIFIRNNVFENNHLGLDIANSTRVFITDNVFKNVVVPWQIDTATTSDIHIDNNQINESITYN